MSKEKSSPLELGEIFHFADSMDSSGMQPIESKEHIKEFFETTNIKHKTRLKRKDVYLLTILEARVSYYKIKYNIHLTLLSNICHYIRDNLVSEGGKAREEFVEAIKDRPEYPIMPTEEPMGGIGGMARNILER